MSTGLPARCHGWTTASEDQVVSTAHRVARRRAERGHEDPLQRREIQMSAARRRPTLGWDYLCDTGAQAAISFVARMTASDLVDFGPLQDTGQMVSML